MNRISTDELKNRVAHSKNLFRNFLQDIHSLRKLLNADLAVSGEEYEEAYRRIYSYITNIEKLIE